MAKGSLRVNGIIVDTDGEIKASTGDSIVIREDDGSAVITVDTNGKTSIGGAMDVGVDDTGYDVKFFGATSGAYLEWDESADELELRGGAATPGKLLLSTAETTVVDGNEIGRINFQAPLDSAGTDAILVGASIHAEADATFSASVNSTDLVFSTGDSATAVERMRIASDGNVGIGETDLSASARVTITPSAHASDLTESILNIGGVEADDAVGTKNSIGFGYSSAARPIAPAMIGMETTDTSGGTYGDLYFATRTVTTNTAPTERMRIDSSGKVGIGTTAPSYMLHVEEARDGDFASLIHNTDADNGQGLMIRAGADSSEAILSLRNQASDVKMIVRADGKVGIGTTAPVAALSIEGNSNTTSEITLKNTAPSPDSYWAITPVYDQDSLAIRSGNNSFGNRLLLTADGALTLTASEGSSASLYLLADEGDDNGDGWRINSNQDSNDLTISTNTSGSYSDKITILGTDGGRIGIGCSPSVNFEVNPTGNAQSYVTITVKNDNTSANMFSVLNVRDHANDGLQFGVGSAATSSSSWYKQSYIESYDRDLNIGTYDEGHSITFRTRPTSGTTTTRMTIDSDGRLGVGITPTRPFHVYGNLGNFVARFQNDGNATDRYGIEIVCGTDVLSSTNDAYWIRLADGDDNGRSAIYYSSSSPSAYFAAISDGRVKKNIQDTNVNGLDTLNAIKLRSFDFDDKKTKEIGWGQTGSVRLGYIAQEVEEVVPEAITTDPDGYKLMGDAPFIPYLIKSVQELSAKNDVLEAEIASLKNTG